MDTSTQKPCVYVETSVISYLTNRLSTNAITLGRQLITQQWWSDIRHKYDCVISEFVIQEISSGHPIPVNKRVEAVKDIRLVASDLPDIETLAKLLIDRRAVPVSARFDALHIATCAINKIEFLASWNFSHIVNPEQLAKIDDVCRQFGCEPSRLVTLEALQ